MILVFRNIFNAQFGPLNKWLASIGIEKIQWFSDPGPSLLPVCKPVAWVSVFHGTDGGVLTGIPRDLYEAAEVEVQTPYRSFKITFPLVMFSTAPLLIMSFAHNFNNFNLIHFLNSNGPVNAAYNCGIPIYCCRGFQADLGAEPV